MSEASSSKRKSPDIYDDEERLKKTLRMDSGVVKKAEEQAASLGDMLPTLQRDRKGVITNEGLEKLYIALCGDTGKDYDSDDSILSETDRMDPEDIAAQDKYNTEILNSIKNMGSEIRCVEEVHANRDNETKEERDARCKKNREFLMGLKTEEEKEAAERKRQRAMERQKTRLENVVQVFVDLKDRGTSFITCSTFSEILEEMANVLPPEKRPTQNHRRNLKKIDLELFAEKIHYIKCNFFTGGKTPVEFAISAVERYLRKEAVLEVFNHPRYGFNFTTIECVLALSRYFSLNAPKCDNGSSIEPLAIRIGALVKSAHYIARQGDPDFVINDALKDVIFS